MIASIQWAPALKNAILTINGISAILEPEYNVHSGGQDCWKWWQEEAITPEGLLPSIKLTDIYSAHYRFIMYYRIGIMQESITICII